MFGVLFLCLFSVGVFAETSIAILDFELSDVTLAPGIPAEIERTGSIKAMLEGELKRAGYKSLLLIWMLNMKPPPVLGIFSTTMMLLRNWRRKQGLIMYWLADCINQAFYLPT